MAQELDSYEVFTEDDFVNSACLFFSASLALRFSLFVNSVDVGPSAPSRFSSLASSSEGVTSFTSAKGL